MPSLVDNIWQFATELPQIQRYRVELRVAPEFVGTVVGLMNDNNQVAVVEWDQKPGEYFMHNRAHLAYEALNATDSKAT